MFHRESSMKGALINSDEKKRTVLFFLVKCKKLVKEKHQTQTTTSKINNDGSDSNSMITSIRRKSDDFAENFSYASSICGVCTL